jgi:Gas vesicle synthesis protein GvpL/GvpF
VQGLASHYLYGFLRSSAPLPALEGLERGAPVFAVGSDEVACAVSLVPAVEYQQHGLARDERWLAPRAMRHHEVLSALHRATAVLPLRFGTLCASGDDVRALLADRSAELMQALASVDGRDEWTLRMTADADAIANRCDRESPVLIELREREAGLSEGRAYFARKQRANTLAVLVSHAMAAIEDAALERVARPCARVVRGRRASMPACAEAALLVARDDLAAIKMTLADVEAEQAWCGLRFALTGPWPVYSFAPALGSELGRE